MAAGNDILQLMPDIAAIGFEQLQAYCDEWIKRPIAQQFGVVQLMLTPELVLQVLLDKDHTEMIGQNAFVPIDELVGFIIDQHFTEPSKRRELHAQWRGVREEFGTTGRHYEALAGRIGTLYIKCRNPHCDVLMETTHKATEGTNIICPPTQVTCTECGHTDLYDGSDFRLVFKD